MFTQQAPYPYSHPPPQYGQMALAPQQQPTQQLSTSAQQIFPNQLSQQQQQQQQYQQFFNIVPQQGQGFHTSLIQEPQHTQHQQQQQVVK